MWKFLEVLHLSTEGTLSKEVVPEARGRCQRPPEPACWEGIKPGHSRPLRPLTPVSLLTPYPGPQGGHCGFVEMKVLWQR